jgi:outer membrane protein assembly factor BamB
MTYRFISTCLLCLIISINAFCQWPQWRGPSRDGISNETNLLKKWPAEGPRLLWSVSDVGDGFSSTAIQDQMIYTSGKRDSVEILSAIDMNGNVKWQKVIGRALVNGEFQQSRGTPTVYKNKIYALTALGDIACFDAVNGNTEWKLKAFETFKGTYAGTAESPLVIDDKVIITPCGYQTTMVALNRLTGRTIWKSESLQDSNFFTSPVLINGKNKKYIFQSTNLHNFIADSRTGAIIWKDKRVSGMVPQIINNNQIYYTGDAEGGTMCRWNEELQEHTVLWTDTVASMEIGGAAVIGDKIIVSALPRGIACIDIKTGKVIAKNTRLRSCNFLVADKMLYCYEDGTARIYLFNLEGNRFELISSFKTSSGAGPAIAHMAISNGMLFIRHGKALMAYDLKQRT